MRILICQKENYTFCECGFYFIVLEHISFIMISFEMDFKDEMTHSETNMDNIALIIASLMSDELNRFY